jgi:LDH2 family malate/lactate/ureidoglycolate dehydrogenase
MNLEPMLFPVNSASALSIKALSKIGYNLEEATVITAPLIDAELCGYPSLGLSRILTIAEDPRTAQPRSAPRVVHETAVSAMIDGGNNVGLYVVQRAARIAIEKARVSQIAVVGVHNSFLSGRSGFYMEMIARAGLVAIHLASGPSVVAPPGARVAALGTNPIAFGIPNDPDPFVFDMSTSSMSFGDLVLAARLKGTLPEGVAIDAAGQPTCDPDAAMQGALLSFAGYKGFGLGLTVQMLCLLAGAAIPRGDVHDFGFLFVVFSPALLMPVAEFKRNLAELIGRIKRVTCVVEAQGIRFPSERAFREREQRRAIGITLQRNIYEKICAL